MFRINLQPARPAWHAPAAVACFVLAAIAGLGGSLLTTNAILNAHDHPTLYAVGLTSLILSLPIAILGAHCLDLLDQTAATMLKDFKLFSPVCIAQFIVWRTLRRNRKEREFRLKRLTLVHNSNRDWRGAVNS